MQEGATGVLSGHANSNAPITANASRSTISLSSIDTSASALVDIDNFYCDNKIDANDAKAIT